MQTQMFIFFVKSFMDILAKLWFYFSNYTNNFTKWPIKTSYSQKLNDFICKMSYTVILLKPNVLKKYVPNRNAFQRRSRCGCKVFPWIIRGFASPQISNCHQMFFEKNFFQQTQFYKLIPIFEYGVVSYNMSFL